MTTLFNTIERCPLCGETFACSEIGSTNAFGSPDLDTRPPEMQRSTMAYWLKECPHCGYVTANIHGPAQVDMDFVQTEFYQTCEMMDFESELAERFYRHWMISINTGEYVDAFYDLVHAAWACDDCGDTENAAAMRFAAISAADKLAAADRDETITLIRADLLRRTGQFDRLINEYKDAKFSEPLLNSIVQYQLQLAEQCDSGWHTVEEALQ